MKVLLFVIALLVTETAVAALSADARCMTFTLYKESSLDNLRGQRAVYDIVMNRSKLQKKSVCSIIRQRGQFSFMKKGTKIVVDKKMIERYYDVIRTKQQLNGSYTHFYLTNMKHKPAWRKKMSCRRIGKYHSFCKGKE